MVEGVVAFACLWAGMDGWTEAKNPRRIYRSQAQGASTKFVNMALEHVLHQ
jgi:hypothetical protein